MNALRLRVAASACLGTGAWVLLQEGAAAPRPHDYSSTRAAFMASAAHPGARPVLFTGHDACPLSDEDRRAAVDTFQKMMPVFQHPRCANCHGAIDVFAEDAEEKHGGGRIAMDEVEVEVDAQGNPLPPCAPGIDCDEKPRRKVKQKHPSFATCDNCHDVPHWRPPTPEQNIGFAAKSRAQICQQVKREQGPVDFLRHMATDPLILASFEGRRGVRDLAPQPPSMTHAQFERLAGDWVAALHAEGGWPGGSLSDCGCVPPGSWSGVITWSGSLGLDLVGLGQSSGTIQLEFERNPEDTEGDYSFRTASGTVTWKASSRATFRRPDFQRGAGLCTVVQESSGGGTFALKPGDGPVLAFGGGPQGVGPEHYMLVVVWSGETTPLYKLRESGCDQPTETLIPLTLLGVSAGGVMQKGADQIEGRAQTMTGVTIGWKLSRRTQ